MPIPIYHYHPTDGTHVLTTEARTSPLDPGAVLVPAFSTTIAPPQPGPREAAVYREGDWRLVPDWRGVPLWRTSDGRQIRVRSVGDTPETHAATDQQPPDAFHVWRDGAWNLDPARLAAARTEEVTAAIQRTLDQAAGRRRYDNAMSVRSYAGWGDGTTNPYRAEAEAFAAWCAACWRSAGSIQDQVVAGQRPLPTVADVLAEMPTCPWLE